MTVPDSGVRERIMRCLALSQSSNEHEAFLAMTKARELMAKYHMEVSIEDMDPHMTEVTTRLLDYPFTKKTRWWISSMMEVLCERYCCRVSYYHRHRCRTYRPRIFGRRCDVDAVEDAAVAIAFVEARIAGQGLDRNAAFYYGRGFAAGLNEAFKEQDEARPEMALVMSVPEEVNAAYKCAVTGRPLSGPNYTLDFEAFERGLEEGRRHLQGKLQGDERRDALPASGERSRREEM